MIRQLCQRNEVAYVVAAAAQPRRIVLQALLGASAANKRPNFRHRQRWLVPPYIVDEYSGLSDLELS